MSGCVALDGRVRLEHSSMKKHPGMALAPVTVIVAAAAALAVQSSAAKNDDPPVLQCAKGDATVVQEIETPGASFKVLCKTNSSKGASTPPKVCADPQCAKEDEESKTLHLACPGGSADPVTRDHSGLLVKCPQLPNVQATLFLLCGDIGRRDPKEECAVEFRVLPPPPQGPQVCAAKGTTTTLGIRGDKSQTRFGCPKEGLTALNPLTPGKVFKEDCTSEEDLEDLTFSAGEPYNTLVAIKKPRTRKLCYVCKKAASSKSPADECRVFIEVSGGQRLFGRTALGLAIPCILAVLRLT